jgi:predicted ATPase/DNA-binding CsgD family transcriptional regulator
MSVGQGTQRPGPPAEQARAPAQRGQATRAARPPEQAGQARRTPLPVETTSFVGREAELARLTALLSRARLVTVTGPPGVGKSRLALRAAAGTEPGFADGACLAGVRDPELLADAVARALGLPAPGPGARPEQLPEQLSHRQLLLILDGCEHLVDACAMLAEALIARAPQVTLLTTSREPLDVSGENACPLGPLPVDQDQPAEAGIRPGTAAELFIQRAAAAVPGFAPGPGDLAHVVRLCQRLDGLPLAIELAAVRLRALPLAELAARLDQSLGLLTSGHRGSHHRSLRDAIGWSHDLCTPAERALWARLSVFAGPFTMSAAEAVCAADLAPAQVMPTLIRLVDKSLLSRVQAEPTRYLMLGAVREFGTERLAADADDSAPGHARERMVGWYLALAGRFRDQLAGDEQADRLRELGCEHANLMTALEYALGDADKATADGLTPAGLTAAGVELAVALSGYWRVRCLLAEGAAWLDRAVQQAPAHSAPRSRALLARARLLTTAGRAPGALAAATAGLGIAVALDDATLIAYGELARSGALGAAGRLAAAAESGQEAARRLAALGDPADLADLAGLHIQLGYLALRGSGNGAGPRPDSGAALGHVDRGLRQLEASGERWLHARLYLVASLALYQERRDIESTWTACRALTAMHEAGDTLGSAAALELLGWVAARAGSYQRAAWLLGGADPRWDRAGGRLVVAPPFSRAHDEAAASCASALGGKRFAELRARGAAHPGDALVAFALSDAGDPAAEPGARLRLPAQLTAREREIASLVAAGLSNRQIAERLFISRRTVDAHLEHIFGKLGITSRVMLTIQLREFAAEPASAG